MGYIFDAMNQSGDDELRDPQDAMPQDDAAMEPTELEPIAQVDPPEDSDAPNDAFAQATEADPQATLDETFVVDEIEDGEASDIPPTLDFNSMSPPIEVQPQWIERIDDRLVALTNPGSIMAEEYRSIRTSMLARWEHRRHLVHTITSATPQEGKTITSVNLGLTFAELHNRKTVVIECDLRLPTFAKLLELEPREGLVAYLRGEAKLSDIIQTVGEGGLHVIPAGGRANNESVQLLSSQRMVNLIRSLRAKFDHVIIDTPPVVELADAGILGALSDDVLLIARMNRTPRPLIDQAIRTLRSYNAPVAGMIATDQKRLRRRYYYYRYGYRYRYYAKQAA